MPQKEMEKGNNIKYIREADRYRSQERSNRSIIDIP